MPVQCTITVNYVSVIFTDWLPSSFDALLQLCLFSYSLAAFYHTFSQQLGIRWNVLSQNQEFTHLVGTVVMTTPWQ